MGLISTYACYICKILEKLSTVQKVTYSVIVKIHFPSFFHEKYLVLVGVEQQMH